ncbi:sirohydrochlorin chelatase [Streptomyces sp. DSM 44917]|uniref:Sirohydrochlorin chelatase n=1 Tax=Streptomyces boetiae TaxID=3075541 RepID=A0ABU2L5E9_9ACTN|nr:sirohydrochlorin chelatase [Streptomyces sp. DSM 44917]MDT0306779.1 sirohydrochlorin chelatase [Streptomyces sp. DSM 44917]
MHPTTQPALLIVGHGSRDEGGAEAFRSFVRGLAGRTPEGVAVAGGFIELSPPPLTEAVAELAAQGARRMAAVPLMLVSAGHAKGDIPAALARERLRLPGLSFAYGRPLGPHPGLLSVLERRVEEAAGGWARSETTVLLVGRGSTDPDANAEVFKAARLLWEGRGYAGVETAFVSLAAPDVAAGLERCRALGARRIVVLPYFLFTGILPDRVRAQAAAWAEAHPEAGVRHAAVIGPEPELSELVLARYREALEGDIRMNCDACVYRVALPGFADKVGLPQQPHHHPGDHDHAHHGHGPHDHGSHDHGPHDHEHGHQPHVRAH